MKKSMGILLTLFLVVVTITACGTSNTSSSTSAPATTASDSSKPSEKESAVTKVVRVVIAAAVNDVDKENNKKIKDLFEKVNPGYKLEFVEMDNKVESGKITTLLNSGVDLPNAINISSGPGRVAVLSGANLIMQLDDFYAKNGWADKLNPGAYNYISGNKIFEVPNAIDAIEIYYNKDIFQNLGIEVPKTSTDFMNALQKIKASGMTPISVGARDGFASGWLFGNILEATAGHKTVDKVLYGQAKWNDDAYVKAVETLGDWVKQGFIDKESVTISDNDAKARFLDKKQAMIAIGTWFITDIIAKKAEENVGMFTLPSFVAGESTLPTGGPANSWVIPAKVKDVDLSVKWINFILSNDYAKFLGQDPNSNSISASKAFGSNPPVGKLLQQAIKSIEQGAAYNPSVFIGAETKSAYYQNLQGIIGGLVKPKDAMANIQAGADKDASAGFKLTKSK
ncbi:ABC transporter substrate-binding protein [Paenibacillus roseipurpureus]|uniref:Extracellular solute-binding protein n=1 Tax=Paenibacillus roseopurpureus TaxID=2918901 RepID=A0AA96RNY2_9BACL|nr:extracellular solute-binding protein [Paenibacillus sp. MBLB1832]WNR46042.1 extracellular solute-binding protein [Paenibacillus sp. MBLB1832]